MAFHVQCPQCQTTLRLGSAAAGSVTVRCPQCAGTFVAELGERQSAAFSERSMPAGRAPAAPAAPARRQESWDEPRERPKQRARRARSSSRGLIIGLSIGVGLLVVAVIVVALLLFLRTAPAPQNIVGVWQKQGHNPNLTERIEFRADGKLLMDFAVLRLEKKYRVVDAGTIEIEETMFNDLFKNFKVEGLPVQFNDNMGALMKHNVSFELRGDELIFAPNAAGLNGTYRRLQ